MPLFQNTACRQGMPAGRVLFLKPPLLEVGQQADIKFPPIEAVHIFPFQVNHVAVGDAPPAKLHPGWGYAKAKPGNIMRLFRTTGRAHPPETG